MNRIPSTAAGLRAATGAFVACLIFCGAAASAPLRFAATERIPRAFPIHVAHMGGVKRG